MVQTRRSFVRSLAGIGALAPFGGVALPGSARAFIEERAPAVEEAADFASLVRSAALSSPVPDSRAKAAIDGTLARLDGFALDHARGRFVLVNIAAAEVVAYQDGREALRSKAVVGAVRTPTPRLASVVPSVRLNPPWYVPASI